MVLRGGVGQGKYLSSYADMNLGYREITMCVNLEWSRRGTPGRTSRRIVVFLSGPFFRKVKRFSQS